MPTEYSETEHLPGEDATQDVCEALAHGKPWVFLVAEVSGDDVSMQVNVGGGIPDSRTLRHVLHLALQAIPKER